MCAVRILFGGGSPRVIGSWGASYVLGFWTLALLVIAGSAILAPFQRRIGGEGGGSEKAIVGVLWLVAAIVIGLAVASS